MFVPEVPNDTVTSGRDWQDTQRTLYHPKIRIVDAVCLPMANCICLYTKCFVTLCPWAPRNGFDRTDCAAFGYRWLTVAPRIGEGRLELCGSVGSDFAVGVSSGWGSLMLYEGGSMIEDFTIFIGFCIR